MDTTKDAGAARLRQGSDILPESAMQMARNVRWYVGAYLNQVVTEVTPERLAWELLRRLDAEGGIEAPSPSNPSVLGVDVRAWAEADPHADTHVPGFALLGDALTRLDDIASHAPGEAAQPTDEMLRALALCREGEAQGVFGTSDEYGEPEEMFLPQHLLEVLPHLPEVPPAATPCTFAMPPCG